MAHYHLQQKGPVVAITMQKEKYNKALNIQVGKRVAFSENGQQDDEKDYIHIKIVDAESKKNPSDELFIKIKPNAQLVKLMNAYYSKRQNMPVGSVRFFHHEVCIFPFNTPKDLGMKNGDSIDTLIEQIGG